VPERSSGSGGGGDDDDGGESGKFKRQYDEKDERGDSAAGRQGGPILD
jgi:hypothetical protein